VLEPNPPINGPTALAYRPDTGLTPARTPEAIPSGTLLMAPLNPAIALRPTEASFDRRLQIRL